MSLIVEAKYISIISPSLRNFRKKSKDLWTFSCPICGDSHKNPHKARGYIYLQKDIYWYHCHNCTASMPFSIFLKDNFSNQYKSFLVESFTNKKTRKQVFETSKRSEIQLDFSLKDLKSLDLLFPNNKAKDFILRRKIPTKYHTELFLCDGFKKWTNKLIPGKIEKIEIDEERIVIPFFDSNNKFFGYQGRALHETKNTAKYITILLDDNKPKIWGLNHVNLNSKFYVVEGPFDAMFLDNAIATAGGKLTSEIQKISCNKKNAIVIYDNEPRNRDVCRNIDDAIISGYSVVIWPNHIKEKDINDMALNGIDYKNIIKKNTFKDLEAKMRFLQWKKI